MSYINDALRKAQNGKNNSYEDYRDIIAPPAAPKVNSIKKWVIGITALILFLTSTALILYNYYQDKEPKKPTNVRVPLPQAIHLPTPSAPIPLPIESRPVAPLPDKPLAEEQILHKNKQLPVVNVAAYAEKFYQEAIALQRNRRFAEAESLYEKTLALEPKHVYALNNLGVVYMSRNKNGQAVKAFRKAIHLKKDYADPYYNLACLHSKWNNIDSAMRYLRTAVSINSEIADWARTDKDLNNLRASPEFKSLIEIREDK